MGRLATAILAATLFYGCACRATPIVVLRTDDGFIVGTNAHRSVGTDVCKLHYSSNDVLLMGAPHTSVFDRRTQKYDFDIDDEIWKAFEKGLTGKGLLDEIQAEITDSVARHLQAVREIGVSSLQFHLTLIHFDLNAPVIYTRVLSMYPDTGWKSEVATDAEFQKPLNLLPGQILIWEEQYPQIISGNNRVPNFKKLLTAVPGWAQGGDEALDFSPPYLILRLNRHGLSMVDPDNGICTEKHPLNTVHKKRHLPTR